MYRKYWIDKDGMTQYEVGKYAYEYNLPYSFKDELSPKLCVLDIKSWQDCINNDLNGIWKYEPILPIKRESAYALTNTSFNELPSPVRSDEMAKLLGVKEVFLFPCVYGRSGTFKDIEASFIMGKIRDWNIVQPLSFHSTGNTARAYHEYAIAAHCKTAGFFPLACVDKFIGASAHSGNDLYAYNGHFQQLSQCAKQWAKENHYTHLAPLLWKVEGKTPLGYHIMNSVPHTTNIVQTIAGGYGVLGIYEAIKRLGAWGLVQKMPTFNLYQLKGVDTFARLLPYKKDIFETDLQLPFNTFELTLQSTNPLSTFNYVRRVCEKTDSQIQAVSENDIIKYANEFTSACNKLNIPISFVDEKSPYISYAGLRKHSDSIGFHGDEVISFIITGAKKREGTIPTIKIL